jgi:hypothetical protein
VTVLNTATKVYLGTAAATAVYSGTVKVWPSGTVHVERIQARPGTGGTSATSGNFTHGAGFTATMNGTITHIATYHYAPTHTLGQIHPLSLWTSAGVKVAHIDWSCPGGTLLADLVLPTPTADDPEPRATAWYEVPLAVPYAIVSGSTYRVSCAAPSYTYFSTAPPASLAPHLTAIATGFYIAGQDVFPTTAQPANYYPIDVVAEFRY